MKIKVATHLVMDSIQTKSRGLSAVSLVTSVQTHRHNLLGLLVPSQSQSDSDIETFTHLLLLYKLYSYSFATTSTLHKDHPLTFHTHFHSTSTFCQPQLPQTHLEVTSDINFIVAYFEAQRLLKDYPKVTSHFIRLSRLLPSSALCGPEP